MSEYAGPMDARADIGSDWGKCPHCGQLTAPDQWAHCPFRKPRRLIRCDLCPIRHREGSALYNEHLLGRDPLDLAEPTRSEMYPV